MPAVHYPFKKAAEKILNKADRPLTPKEIVEEALEEGLIKTEGATPDATMGAQLYVDIRNNAKSKFKKVGRGKFTLRRPTNASNSAEVIIDDQNNAVRENLREKLHAMDPSQFEVLVAELLEKLGYEKVKVTGRTGDKGIDVVATLTMGGITSVKTVVQVKRYKQGKNLSGAIIAQLRGSAEVDQRGLVITTSDFTKEGKKEASASNKMPVALVNGDMLLDLLFSHRIGVRRELMPVYEIDTDYFENAESEFNNVQVTGKKRGLWPLPGGQGAYLDTLYRLLDTVGTNNLTNAELLGWFLKEYEQVQSEKTALGYATVPRTIGLTTIVNGKVILTNEGKQAQATRNADFIYTVLAKNVLGVEEIMEFLKTAKEPQTESDVLAFLKDNLDIDWTTFAQVNFRLIWLVNLGKLKRVEGGYELQNSQPE